MIEQNKGNKGMWVAGGCLLALGLAVANSNKPNATTATKSDTTVAPTPSSEWVPPTATPASSDGGTQVTHAAPVEITVQPPRASVNTPVQVTIQPPPSIVIQAQQPVASAPVYVAAPAPPPVVMPRVPTYVSSIEKLELRGVYCEPLPPEKSKHSPITKVLIAVGKVATKPFRGGAKVDRTVYPPPQIPMLSPDSVRLCVGIDASGAVREARALEGNPALLQAALAATSRWTYVPDKRQRSRDLRWMELTVRLTAVN